MADSPLDQLLLELGIDLSPVQKAGEQIKSILSDLNTASDATIGKAKEQTSAQATNISQMRQLAEDAVNAAIQAISYQKEKQAVLETQTAEYKKQVAGQESLSAGAQKLAAEELTIKAHLEAQTAEIQKQIAERQKERLVEQQEAKERKESFGGQVGTAATKIGGALLGPGIGGLIGAVTGGELIAHGIEQSVEGIVHLIEKLKEASVESGKLTQVMDRFNKLAAGAGIDGPKFLDELSVATEGLVSKFSLAQLGARALQANIKGLTPEKIAEVTEAVVKLAESSGHTAEQGVNALGSALYRGGQRAGAMLANVTGLSRTQLQVANLSPILNRTQRDVESLNHAFATLIAEAAKLGEVPRTLDQASQQWKVIKTDLFASFGQGFNESGGTQAFLKFFAEFTRNLEGLSDKAKEFGDRLGQAFVLFIPALDIVEGALKRLMAVVGDVVKSFGRMSGALDKDEVIGGIRAIGNALFALKPMIDGFIISVGTLARTMMGLWEVVTPAPGEKTISSKRLNTGLTDVTSAWHDAAFNSAVSQLETQQQQQKFNESLDQASNKKPTAIRPGQTDDSNIKELAKGIAIEKQQEQALLGVKKAADALDLARQKTKIEESKRLDDDAYQAGEESLAKHLEVQKTLAKQTRDVELARIEEDRKAKNDKLDAGDRENQQKVKSSPQLMSASDAAKLHVVTITEKGATDLTAGKESEQAEQQYQKQLLEIDKQGGAARYAEQHKAITDRLSLAEDGAKAEEELNKQLYQQGAISADTYIQSQIDSIQKLAALKKQASDDTVAAAKTNQKYTIELGQAEADANLKTTQDAIQKLKTLQEQVTSLRLGGITNQYGNQNKGIENQIGIQQSQPGVAFSTSTASLIQTLQKNLQTEMSRLVALANTPEAQANPDTWFKIYEQIQNITQEQLKWNQALQEQLDMMRQVGTGLESIGTTIGTNFQSKFAQSLAKNVQTGAKGLQDSFKTQNILSGAGAVTPDQKIQQMADKMSTAGTSVVTSYTNLQTAIQAVINSFTQLAAQTTQNTQQAEIGPEGVPETSGMIPGNPDNTGETSSGSGSAASTSSSSAPGTLQTFTTKLGAAITQVDSFTQSILHSKNALTGAAGGAAGGAGLGNSIPGLPPGVGALLGAGAGALLGGIVGQKNAQMTANLTNFADQYKQIMNQFALNTNNLNDTIVQLAGLVTQIQAMQSSSKKGSAQYQQLIDQYNAQIMQMEQQQNQIIINMNEMSAISSAPLGQQSALGGIQSILQQYEQYAGAIQSVNQLMQQGQTYAQATTNVTNQQAAAYQYLTGALAAYEQNLVNQLNQDEQQAIQTALQLNDLLYQRQQMMLQYNDQVESVLSAGVLTRQLTRAQTAGQQIEQLTVQYNMQMDQINEQISADQYSVSVATTIFNLAQTRIGLENQLLTAQNYQTTQSMAQIASLQQLVNQIQSGNFQSGALGLLLGAIPGSTNGGVTMTPLEILQTFAGLIASNPAAYAAALSSTATSSSATAADAIFSAAYGSRASMGFAQFRGSNL